MVSSKVVGNAEFSTRCPNTVGSGTHNLSGGRKSVTMNNAAVLNPPLIRKGFTKLSFSFLMF